MKFTPSERAQAAKEKEIFLAGYAAAMLEYSIMRDGDHFIGVRQQPLKPEIKKLPEDSWVSKYFDYAKGRNFSIES